MNTKRIIALIICAVMLLTMIPVVALTSGAAEVEGMWTTYRSAGDYDDPDETTEEGEDPPIYKPEAGYTYTDEGFTIVPADYTGSSPFMTVSTKEKQSVKEGIYLQFRIDEYAYDGGTGADQWICLSLNTGKEEHDGTFTGKVAPGNTVYGGGWLSLIRGVGNGASTTLPHLTDPQTEDFGGTFVNKGSIAAEVPTDEEGREIYTFEVNWTGTEYEIKINGVVQPSAADTTALLEKLDPNGEFFVGVTLMANVQDGKAALTILKYGTSEADATTPVGSDEKEPEENGFEEVTVADPSTVEPNKPAILWTPDTYKIKNGNNCTFTVLGDNTWRVEATETAVFFNWTPKRKWAYNAEDFPVFGIMVRNIWVDGGDLWYAAGDVLSAQDDCKIPFSIYDGEVYEAEDETEYFYMLIDLTDMWEGKINTIRMDLAMQEDQSREFDILFAGMFRSYDEGKAYGEEHLKTIGVLPSDWTEAPETTAEPETEAPETEAATQAPAADTGASGETTAAATTEEEGCASVIGMSAVAVLAAAAAFVALKKKD